MLWTSRYLFLHMASNDDSFYFVVKRWLSCTDNYPLACYRFPVGRLKAQWYGMSFGLNCSAQNELNFWVWLWRTWLLDFQKRVPRNFPLSLSNQVQKEIRDQLKKGSRVQIPPPFAVWSEQHNKAFKGLLLLNNELRKRDHFSSKLCQNKFCGDSFARLKLPKGSFLIRKFSIWSPTYRIIPILSATKALKASTGVLIHYIVSKNAIE